MSRGSFSHGRRRNLLLPSHLEAFRKWIVKRGWFEVPCHPANPYEVLRLRKRSDLLKPGEKDLTIIYKRDHKRVYSPDTEVPTIYRERHLTIQSNLVPYVEQFFNEEIRDRSQPRQRRSLPVTGRP